MMKSVMKIMLDEGAKMPEKAHADETERGDGGFGSTGK